MNIIFFEHRNWEIPLVKKSLQDHKLDFIKEPLTEKNAKKAEKADILCIFINSKIDKKALKKLPNVKYIITRSTGYDHIDLEACKNKNIPVSNIPRYGENTVAEHAFSLLLALSRRIINAHEQIKNKKIDISSLPCFDLKNKTIGIIGAGRIGLHMIKMAKGFEMKVLAYDIYQNNQAAKELEFSYVSLDKLLKNSDIISIHALLTEQTQHLLDNKAFKKMKRGMIIINTARGEIIALDALIKALKEKKVVAAGLDVFEHESLILRNKKENPAIHYLLNHKDVVLTPHMAFYSRESLLRILDSTIETILSFIQNKPINLIK